MYEQVRHDAIPVKLDLGRSINMFGEFIRKSREALGLSCSELARQAGHPVSSIHGIETGANKNPRFRIIIDLSRVLNISIEDMRTAFEEADNE